jgi:hypothetical protein
MVRNCAPENLEIWGTVLLNNLGIPGSMLRIAPE